MNRTIMFFFLTAVIGIYALSLSGDSLQIGFAQQRPVQTAHLICCNLLVSVPGTWAGADRKCGDYLRNAPASVRSDVCDQMRQGGLVCDATAQYCSPQSKKPRDVQCDDPAPWFDRSLSCRDAQSADYRLSANGTAATIYVCGQDLFSVSEPDPLYLRARATVARDIVGKVCCERFREGAQAGSNCDPRTDLDCDGITNDRDLDSTGLPDLQRFRTPDDATVDPFPPGFDPNNPNFRPEKAARESKGVGECPCKWELFRGRLTCSAGGGQPHVYEATWRCPMTGAEVSTNATAPATRPCR